MRILEVYKVIFHYYVPKLKDLSTKPFSVDACFSSYASTNARQ